MKRWHYFALAAALAAGAAYVYMQRDALGLASMFGGGSARSEAASFSSRSKWRTLDRAGDGFRVDLPAEPNDLQVPAYNETGGAEAVKMVMANPDGDTTFAVTWEDNPPVARMSHTPERTLNTARDGMLARTQTTLVSESHGMQYGNLSLDVLARNTGGGVLNARLIYAENRLYILMAVFPLEEARRERDVKRFFDSFATSRPSAISQTMPAASRQ